MAKTLKAKSPQAGPSQKPRSTLDSGSLYLQISRTGARSWVFRYRMGGRKTPRDMGLGSLDSVSLADARTRAAHREGWCNEKHANQWITTLDAYAYPKIGKVMAINKSTD